jgi:signal peptidase II
MTTTEPAESDLDSGGSANRHRAVLVLAATAVLVLLADAATKQLALAALEGRGPVRVLGGAVYFSLTRNSGAAFSLGSEHTWVFPIIAAVVAAWIAWMAVRLRSVPWAVALGLVLGGALGNLADRVFRAPGLFVGHVVDMVSVFGPYGEHFPVFNLADSSLVCGVVLAILLELSGRQRDGSRTHFRRAGGADGADGARSTGADG